MDQVSLTEDTEVNTHGYSSLRFKKNVKKKKVLHWRKGSLFNKCSREKRIYMQKNEN